MEHRWNARKSLTGEVIIECPRIGRVRAMMRDVSVGGMFVETRSGVLPLNAPVMVGFRLPARESEGGYHLHAMIVRRAGRGAGLMFLDLGTGTAEALREELNILEHVAQGQGMPQSVSGEDRITH